MKVEFGSRSVYIIDTPGFNDTTRTDAQVLKLISDILGLQYESGVPLKGILYLRKINSVRMFGSDVRNMRMFREMCGPDVFENVILLTTFWDQVDDIAGGQAQRDLRGFWSDMLERGLEMRRFDGTLEMAQRLIERFLDKPPIVLQIQKELMEEGLSLEDTSAGMILAPDLRDDLAGETTEIRTIEDKIMQAAKAQNVAEQQKQEGNLREAQAKQRRIVDDQHLMQRTVGREITVKFEEKRKLKKWKDGISIVASILGVVITVAVQLILPLAGIAL